MVLLEKTYISLEGRRGDNSTGNLKLLQYQSHVLWLKNCSKILDLQIDGGKFSSRGIDKRKSYEIKKQKRNVSVWGKCNSWFSKFTNLCSWDKKMNYQLMSY